MQPREMMSTCGEKYLGRLSGVTPPLASTNRVGNSTFSVWAATWSSCGIRVGMEEGRIHSSGQVRRQWKWKINHAFHPLYLRLEVVQHNNVCSCSSCFSGFLYRAALHLNLTAEATHRAGSFYSLNSKHKLLWAHPNMKQKLKSWTEHKSTDCWCNCTHLCDTSWCPDMIVLQHHHPTQVLSVHGYATNQHGVLLYQTEAWGGLARSSHLSVPTPLCCHGLQLGTAGSNPRGPGQAIESRPFTKEEASCWASHHSSQSNGIWTCGGVVRSQHWTTVMTPCKFSSADLLWTFFVIIILSLRLIVNSQQFFPTWS